MFESVKQKVPVGIGGVGEVVGIEGVGGREVLGVGVRVSLWQGDHMSSLLALCLGLGYQV